MGDVDREDFFQINTYMSQYQNTGKRVLVGGLLYPIEGKFQNELENCHSETWFGNKQTKFIVDGIDLSNLSSSDSDEWSHLIKQENAFIARVNSFIYEG